MLSVASDPMTCYKRKRDTSDDVDLEPWYQAQMLCAGNTNGGNPYKAFPSAMRSASPNTLYCVSALSLLGRGDAHPSERFEFETVSKEEFSSSSSRDMWRSQKDSVGNEIPEAQQMAPPPMIVPYAAPSSLYSTRRADNGTSYFGDKASGNLTTLHLACEAVSSVDGQKVDRLATDYVNRGDQFNDPLGLSVSTRIGYHAIPKLANGEYR